MTRRRWDNRWQNFPASKPLPVEDGMSTSKRRGQMADTWWSKRFIDVLDSYGLGARMQRGRRYARSGQVMSLDITPGLIAAQVQGSRRTPYLVTVQSPQPSALQWSKVDDAFAARVGFAAQLLAGEVPTELEGVFSEAGVSLFAATWGDLQANCNCPDWENPCKHIAAVLYVYADRLDTDPWLLLLWRGRTRDEVLGHLRAGPATDGPDGPDNPVAPWWPLVPGQTRGEVARSEEDPAAPPLVFVETVPSADPPTPAARVLSRMEPLEAEVGATPLTDLLEGAYETLTDPAAIRLRSGEPQAT
jgi:uncharacterized Zn finger protein